MEPCYAQRVSEFLAVNGWQGNLKLKADYVGKLSGLAGVDDYSFSWSADLQFRLEEFNPGGQFWRGKFTGGAVAVRHKNVNKGSDGCTLTTNILGEGLPLNPEFFLYVGPGNNYRFQNLGSSIQARVTLTTVCGGTTSVISNDRPENWFTSGLDRNVAFALPPMGLNLTGSGQYEMGVPIPLFNVLFGGTLPKLLADISWTFQPLNVDPLELVVDPTDYDNFRPKADLSGNPGNSISVTATLQTKSGKPSTQGATKFIFELLETSREPGIALNWPRDASDQDYDLRIAADAGFLIADAVKRQRAESLPKIPLATTSTVKIDSFDWGGWSRLKVTALLADGTSLVGYLRGRPEQTEIRLPKRTANSVIADSWKSENGVSGSDNSDDETDPIGDSNAGDGLTLYEEYRGFYESQVKIEGNPKKKDYFAINLVGSIGDGGLALFQRLSGLKVHKNLLQTELSSERVINKNVSAGPHRVNQHGVILKNNNSNGYAEAVSTTSLHPSTPKDFDFVGLPIAIASRPTQSQSVSYASASVAHELFHTVNVYHHGEGDKQVVWELGPDDTVLEGGQQIEVYREPSLNVTANVVADLKTRISKSREIWLGQKQGQHSGVENCVMRYDSSQAYEQSGSAGWRYSVTERPGALLCRFAEGTGVNASREPQIRYGDAARGRGACIDQILVNDAISPPVR